MIGANSSLWSRSGSTVPPLFQAAGPDGLCSVAVKLYDELWCGTLMWGGRIRWCSGEVWYPVVFGASLLQEGPPGVLSRSRSDRESTDR